MQCVSSGAVRVQAAIRLRVKSPDPVCRARTADLTLPEVTAGSDANLFYTYWLDAGATQPLTTPFAVPAGKYYIKAEAPGSTGNCFALLPVEVKEILPVLLQPDFSVEESLEIWSPTRDLKALVGNTTGLNISFSLDREALKPGETVMELYFEVLRDGKPF